MNLRLLNSRKASWGNVMNFHVKYKFTKNPREQQHYKLNTIYIKTKQQTIGISTKQHLNEASARFSGYIRNFA